MPGGEHFELIDGVPVEKTMSLLSNRVEAKMIHILEGFSEVNDLGWILGSGCGYRCVPWKPGKIRRPGASFIARDRLPSAEHWSDGYVTIPPDLAVEITSPSDEVYDLERKVEEYLRAGGRLVWVIHPEIRTIQVIRADGSGLWLRAGGELSGEDVLPGFRCPVDALFPPAGPQEPEAATVAAPSAS